MENSIIICNESNTHVEISYAAHMEVSFCIGLSYANDTKIINSVHGAVLYLDRMSDVARQLSR